MLYFAYGSNLNYEQMKKRTGLPVHIVGKGKLQNYCLEFKSNGRKMVANIKSVSNNKMYVDGVVYELTDEQIKRLDKYEGFPAVYTKTKIKFSLSNDTREGFTYILNENINYVNGEIDEDYINKIRDGYELYKFNTKHLDGALKKLYKSKTLNKICENVVSNYVDVFVYGTLLQGEANHHIIENSIFLGTAIAKGDLYQTIYPYPAVLNAGNSNNLVVGEVYRVNKATLERLDILEGYNTTNTSLYFRKKMKATYLGTKEQASVYIYELNPKYNYILSYQWPSATKWESKLR